MKRIESLVKELKTKNQDLAKAQKEKNKAEKQLSWKGGNVYIKISSPDSGEPVTKVSLGEAYNADYTLISISDLASLHRWLNSLFGDATTEYMKGKKADSKPSIWARAIFKEDSGK